MGERAEKEAFVTLATNDTYALGCLVLANSLRGVGTTRQLVVMVTDGVSLSMRNQLSRVFNLIQEVNVFDSNDAVNLQLLGRPDLSCTLTKLHCWRLTQYQKCVFMDADTLVLQNVDDLFDREELSAAPDAGWPDCFNSGVFVFVPSDSTYTSLVDFAMTQGTFDGGDQGLLNMYFHDWATKDIAKHLPFLYNVVSQAFYSYLPAFTQFKDRVKIVHFIGAVKPWHHAYNTATGTVLPLQGTGHSQEFLQLWWNIFIKNVQPILDPSITPFIRFDFIPNPQPEHVEVAPSEPPEPPSGDGTTYSIVYPYVPPALDQVFYTPTSHTGSSDALGENDGHLHEKNSTVIEITSEASKPFNILETHYSEEPLSQINPDSPPKEHYSASDLEDVLKPSTEEICTSDLCPEGDPLECATEKDNPESDSIEDEHDEHDEHDENGNKISCTSSIIDNGGGLVGELASLQIDSSGASGGNIVYLDDRERKLAWERGQMDYLGVDKFENIMKKLDAKIDPSAKAASPPAPEVTPSQPEETPSPVEPAAAPAPAPAAAPKSGE